ncbi:MAG TPA: hypothetical protein VE959_10175 [Bryobacteraceae bacterium]|nr:hypothetical protein [Bryobacteraceae bacterium]
MGRFPPARLLLPGGLGAPLFEELGVNVFNAPSVLSYVSMSDSENCMSIQLVNYADLPAESLTIRIAGKFNAAHLYTPGSAPVDLAVGRSGPGRKYLYVSGGRRNEGGDAGHPKGLRTFTQWFNTAAFGLPARGTFWKRAA